MRARLLVGGSVVMIALFLLPGAVRAVVATSVNCGDTITTSIVVANDPPACPGIGLVVGANKITINLNGHTLQGDGSGGGNGIDATGRSGVTVENGTISSFETGVSFTGDAPTTPNKITGLTARSNLADGFSGHIAAITKSYVVGSGRFGFETDVKSSISGVSAVNTANEGIKVDADRSTIDSSIVVNSGTSGIALNSLADKATNNHVTAAAGSGIYVFGAGATVSGNTIGDSGYDGIDVESSGSVTKNTVTASANAGIVVVSGASSVVSGNTVDYTDASDGIFVGTGKLTVTGNVVTYTHTSGVEINGATSGSNVSGNTVRLAGGDGIFFTGSTSTIASNTIGLATVDGIEIQSGSSHDTVKSNVIDGTAQDGIYAGGDTALIMSNTLRNAHGYGIYDNNGTSDTLKGNTAIADAHGMTTSTGIDGGGNKTAGNVLGDCTGGVVCTAP